MNENQLDATDFRNNTISNTVNEASFNFEKYDPYLDVLRTLFVPSVDKRICELLELFYTDKASIDTPSYWERCLNIVSAIKYEVGLVQSHLKQAFSYLANNGLVNSVINTLVLSNRVDKVCRDLDSLGEKNLRRYANAWNFVNEKSYWRVSNQSVSITEGPNRSGSLLKAEIGSSSSAYPTSKSNFRSSPRNFRNVRKFPKRSIKRSSGSNSENASCSCSSFSPTSAEFGSNNERKLKLLIGDSQSSKYSEIRKLPVPCKCENLIRHFVKAELSESPSGVKAREKLEKALSNTCFSLNQILEPMDSSDVYKCRLLWKLQENYAKIQLKKQETNGDKTCLFTERIDISKKDFSALRNRSSELLESHSNSIQSQSMKNGSKGAKLDGQSVKNDSTLMKRNSLIIKDSLDLSESDLRNSKVNVVSSTKIYDTGIPKKRNKCLDRKYCGNLRGNLCRCPGPCFCDLDSFDDDYTTARTSIKSWGSSVKCDSKHSCNCSSGDSAGSVVDNNNCSGRKCGNDDGDKNCCGSKSSKIDIYININENEDKMSRRSEDSKAKKSISVQTIQENLEPRLEESDRSEDLRSIFLANSSVFEALKAIAEETRDCNKEMVACAEEQLIDFSDSFGENDSAENSSGCEDKSLPEIPKHQSVSKIAKGFVKNIVNQIEENNLRNENFSLKGSGDKAEVGNCSILSGEENLGEKESNFGNGGHDLECNCSKCSGYSCSTCSGSLKTIKEEKESNFGNGGHDLECNCSKCSGYSCSTCSGSLKTIKEEKESNSINGEHEPDCNCSECPGSLEKIKLERKESNSKNENNEDPDNNCDCFSCSGSLKAIKEEKESNSINGEHEPDCNCSECPGSLEKIKLERKESNSKNENNEDPDNNCDCFSCSGSSEERKESSSSNEKPKDDFIYSTCSGSSQEMQPEKEKSSSVSVQVVKLEMRKSFGEEENVEQIEENLQESELEGESTRLIGSFQAETQEFAERKSEISEGVKEVVDEINAPVKLQADEKEVIEGSEGCVCTLDSEDIFISTHSVVQKSAVEIEISKDRRNLSPIVETESRTIESVELKSKLESLDLEKEKSVLKTEDVEEKFRVEKSEMKKSSSEKIQVKEIKIVSSTSETLRSASSDVSKISKASVSLAEANCGSSSYYRSNFCLQKVYLSCDCSKTGQFPRSLVSKKSKNYQPVNSDKLRRHEFRSQMNVCEKIFLGCRNFCHFFYDKTFHIIPVKAYRFFKKRDKATSTSDLMLYAHRCHKSYRKRVSKFSPDHQNLCPTHRKIFNQKNCETKIPCPFLSSTKHRRGVINQRKHSYCLCSGPKIAQPLQKSKSCSLSSNCGCSGQNNWKKRLSESSFSTYSSNFCKNGSGDSGNSNSNKKILATRYLANYLEALLHSRIKLYDEHCASYCHGCRESLGEDIEFLNNFLRMSKN